MKLIAVTFVRVYITESSKLLKPILEFLHFEAKVRGVSVFRAVSGYGSTGEHNIGLVDLSLNLPLAIEFFDEGDKVMKAIEHITTLVKPEHVVFWQAQANE